jgi:hypothetical protein
LLYQRSQDTRGAQSSRNDVLVHNWSTKAFFYLGLDATYSTLWPVKSAVYPLKAFGAARSSLKRRWLNLEASRWPASGSSRLPDFTAVSVRKSNQIRLPFGEGKTSPIAAEDVARVGRRAARQSTTAHSARSITLPIRRTCISMHRSIRTRLAARSPFIEPWRDGLLKLGCRLLTCNGRRLSKPIGPQA